MFYHPPQEMWYLTATKLNLQFSDNKTGSGTGFFVLKGERYFLVTARHVMDPKYRKVSSSARCTKLKLSFAIAVNAGTPAAKLQYQVLEAIDPSWQLDANDLDLAVLEISSVFAPDGERDTRPMSFPIDIIALDDTLGKRFAGEPVVFYGYPKYAPVRSKEGTEFHYPILRQGVFAYPPNHGVDVVGAIGSNYGLIDSFAQSGFSGGPIVSLQKGWGDGSWHPIDQYQPAKLVGMMCGHYRSSDDHADGVHSGMSYFLRSNSIFQLIESMSE